MGQGVQHVCESLGGKPSGAMKVKASGGLLRRKSSYGRRIVDRSQVTLWQDLSESVPVATQKMVNYASIECPHLLSSETTAKGTGLAESAGKEDPTPLRLTLV